MVSIEELVQDLKALTPEQLQQVARVVHEFSLRGDQPSGSQAQGKMPQAVVDEAVRHGWPRELFTEVMGSLPEMERAPQPAYNVRETL
ncbi:MAG: hypothetical protein JO182_12240 [Acidobacteriaceae bacterium]|nr:hypothetical protein [Acidobacteriaceae bacterium]